MDMKLYEAHCEQCQSLKRVTLYENFGDVEELVCTEVGIPPHQWGGSELPCGKKLEE